jgi:hypothetical protein
MAAADDLRRAVRLAAWRPRPCCGGCGRGSVLRGGSDERPASPAHPPSWADGNPPPGAWCRACHGTRWWTERLEPHRWRCLTGHPPVHLAAAAIRREGEGDAIPLPRAQDAEPLFRQAGSTWTDRAGKTPTRPLLAKEPCLAALMLPWRSWALQR